MWYIQEHQVDVQSFPFEEKERKAIPAAQYRAKTDRVYVN